MKPKTHPSRQATSDSSAFGCPQRLYPVLSVIFDKIYPAILALATLGLTVSLYRTLLQSAWYPVFFMHTGMYLAVVAVSIFRRRFSVPLTFSFMLMIIYLIGAESLYRLGLAGTSMIHLVMLCAFASVFLGIRSGMIASSIVVATVIFIAIWSSSDIIVTKPVMSTYLLSPTNWIIHIVCLVMYLAPFALSVHGLQKKMLNAMQELRAGNRQLEAEVSMRRHAEEALRESETKLRQVIDLVPNFIFAKDRNGRFVLANKAVADAFGTTVEELTGKTDAHFNANTEEVEHFLKNDLLVIDGGSSMEIPEEKITDSKGHTRILRTIKIPFTLSSTGTAAVLGVSTDITEYKRSEKASKENERRFRELADLLPQAVAEFDMQGNFTYGNACGLEIFGYTQKEFEENTFNLSQMFIPDDLQRLRNNIQGILEGKKGSDNNEYTAVRKNDGTFPVMLYASPIIREGKLSGIRAIAVDITERKNIERAHLESEAKYRSVVESSIVGFYIIQDGIFRFVNQRFCSMVGYTSDEIVDTLGPMHGIHPDDRTKVEESLRKRAQGEADSVEYDIRAIRKDGKIVTLRVFGNSIDYNGRTAMSGTCIDITKEWMLESQLRQAQKMEAVGQLAGGIAHDFNNILTALVGYGSLLQIRMDKTNPLRSYVDQILSAAQKASDLTKSLLTFGRQQPIHLQSVNINNIIRGTEPLLNRLLTEGITLETRFTSNNLTVTVDITQIDQILFNLIANARDAISKNGKIIIETKPVTLSVDFAQIHGFGDPGNYALLSVSDTGKGIDEKTREKIFEPFFTTKEAGKGTGLGLSTVYGIVKQHKGYITIYSEPGFGTTFHVYLPMKNIEVAAEQTSSFSQKRGHETILVAENSEEVRRFVKEILSLCGYAILEAADYEETVEQLQKNGAIDLVVVDSALPNKNRKGIYETIIGIKPEIKVLFLSGHLRDVTLFQSIRDKGLPTIPKPLIPNELLEKVRELLHAS
jgi:PAS domain S-box-containing protein